MANEVPSEVVEAFNYWLGTNVDTSKIVRIPSDGYRDYQHGEFDFYILRRGENLYKIMFYEDGHVHFR